MIGSGPAFIDAFAGCGGLSLGLLQAGWTGAFAIERDANAFQTYIHNILDGRFRRQMAWPSWLERSPHSIDELLLKNNDDLKKLQGEVALIAGGPPCQGFSSAGRRKVDDPRNQLMREYLRLVSLIQPNFVLLENVRGITVGFKGSGQGTPRNYAEALLRALSIEYDVGWRMMDAREFGVPQARTRFILVGCRKGIGLSANDVFEAIEEERRTHLRASNLLVPVDAYSAISDLEIGNCDIIPSPDSPGFHALAPRGARSIFQRMMSDNKGGQLSDTRLARHSATTVARFAEIITECHKNGRLNVSVGRLIREQYGMKKQALRVLDPQSAAPTITSMPDDLLHYREPRTLTVRENARLQSFPDWFQFKGKYTSGGLRRRSEVPRFTQVANAVPPLMALVFGTAIARLQHVATSKRGRNSLDLRVDQNRNVGEIIPMVDELFPERTHALI